MQMLKQLTKEEFERRCAGGRRTPVFREYLADRETPVSVLTRSPPFELLFCQALEHFNFSLMN